MISVGNKEVTAIRVGERVVATVYIGPGWFGKPSGAVSARAFGAVTNPGAERMAGNG